MRMIKGRASAISMAFALLAVAFTGLFFVEGADNPTTLSVDVTAGPIYDGDDVIFNLTGWGYEWDIAENFTVTVTIGTAVTDAAMIYNQAHDYFDYTWTAVPGDYNWMVEVINTTDSNEWNSTGTLHVFAYPEFVGTSAIAMSEDVPYEWNLSAEFTGEGLTFAEETAPSNLTLAKNGAIWTVTPASNWSGTEEVNLTATDVNGRTVPNIFTFTVGAVNDPPVIVGIDFKGETLLPEDKNITTEVDENGTAINWTTVSVIEMDILEDEMEVNFTVNATDVETDVMNLTYTFTEGANYTITLVNDTIPYWFGFTGAENLYGIWEATLTVSDGDDPAEQVVWFNVGAVNDPPTGEFTTTMPTNNTFEIETDTNLTVEVSAADVDDTNLTVIWKVEGVTAQESNATSFTYKWSADGNHTVTVYVSDGVNDDVLIGSYVAVVAVPPPTWTADDVATNYTEKEGDVVVADVEGLLTYTYSNGKAKSGWDGIDIVAITTALDGDNLVVTISFKGAPYGMPTSSDITSLKYKTPSYKLYFVKSTFSEPKFDLASPQMNFAPADADVYSMGLFMDYISYPAGDYDDYTTAVSGNDMTFTVPLSLLDDAGIPADDFNVFFTATLTENKISLLHSSMKAGYDSAGYNSVAQVTSSGVVTPGPQGSSFPWLVVILIILGLIVVVVVVVIIMMKGKKGKEEEGEAPPEEGEPPAEGEEMPMGGAELPMEGEQPVEGVEQPPVEEGVEQPVAPEEAPHPPEEPAPEAPAAPEPPMPPEPASVPPEPPVPEAPVAPEPPVPPQ